MYVGKQFFDAVGGFNENLLYYGREDEDFADRLSQMGLHRHIFQRETIEHIPHSIATSLESQTNIVSGQTEKEYNHFRHWMVEANKLIEKNLVWSNTSPRIKWGVTEIEPNRFLAKRDVKK
jgi:predicted glycosyltransferase involved in capsule biosynthesis